MADALVDAVEKNDVALVNELIGRGVDVDGVDRFGESALHFAAREGFVGCSEVLLEANADVDKADRDGWTPLHTASYNGRAECVKVTFVVQLLIDWKANVNAKTNDGYSPLHMVAEQGHLACVEMLIPAGAEVDAPNNFGFTPIAFAIYYNKHDVAELLLDKGGNLSNVNERIEITDWMNVIVAKRQNVRRSLTTFIGVLRKRFAVCGGGTEYTRGRLSRDFVGVISKFAWSTRFDKRWEGAVLETVNELKL